MTTVPPDAAGLLAAVAEKPDDDAQRLIYADWCEENGQPERAEFIRVQVEAVGLNDVDRTCPDLDNYGRGEPRWKEGKCVCRGCILRRREHELLGRNWASWCLDLPDGFLPHGCKPEESRVYLSEGNNDEYMQAVYRRGFVAEVELHSRVFLIRDGFAGRLFAAHPIEAVRLEDRRPACWSSGLSIWYLVGDLAGWREAGYTPSDGHLPLEVFRLLKYGGRDDGDDLRHYECGFDAREDLSQAMVAWGRSEAARITKTGQGG